MGALPHTMTRAQLGHWLPVAIVIAAALIAFVAALDLSLYLPVELD